MAALVLKTLPDNVHKRLKEQAERNRRSMAQEAITILERSLGSIPPVVLPRRPVQPLKRVTSAMILRGIREGRA
jgi:hypothetical protein